MESSIGHGCRHEPLSIASDDADQYISCYVDNFLYQIQKPSGYPTFPSSTVIATYHSLASKLALQVLLFSAILGYRRVCG